LVNVVKLGGKGLNITQTWELFSGRMGLELVNGSYHTLSSMLFVFCGPSVTTPSLCSKNSSHYTITTLQSEKVWWIVATLLQKIFNSMKVGLEISRLQLKSKGTISTDSGSDIFHIGTEQ